MRGKKGSISVYVVDDDEAVRDSLAVLLELEGFLVKVFPTPVEFLNAMEMCYIRHSDPKCLLLDLHMPGKGGHELLEQVIARKFRIPVVVMTGNADKNSRDRAMKSGAVAFLEKPVDADILIETIKIAQHRI